MIKKFKINDRLSSIFTSPEIPNDKYPAILFVHGFASDKNEVGNTFALAADKLAEQGISSLRFDFSGFGESEGDTTDTTIETFIKDADDALLFLLNLKKVDINRIGICGFSLGAGISVLIAENQSTRIKSMTLISPAGDLQEDFVKYLGMEQYKSLEKATEVLELDLGWRKIKLKNKFIESLKRHSLMDSITKYHHAFFTVAGTNDFSYKHAKDYFSRVNADKKKELFIENADHIFNAFEPSSTISEVVDNVSLWFKKTL